MLKFNVYTVENPGKYATASPEPIKKVSWKLKVSSKKLSTNSKKP
jgi:hypothetical protein